MIEVFLRALGKGFWSSRGVGLLFRVYWPFEFLWIACSYLLLFVSIAECLIFVLVWACYWSISWILIKVRTCTHCLMSTQIRKQNVTSHPEATLVPPPFQSLCPLLGKMWFLKIRSWASLVVQWLRIRLPMQGPWVPSLVREDPTCHRATKPVRHNYWAWALEPASYNYWARMPQLMKPACLEPVLRNKRSHDNGKLAHRNEE